MGKMRDFMKSILASFFVGVVLLSAVWAEKAIAEEAMPFRDTSLSFEERAADLLSRLTLEEKVSLLNAGAAAIPRLGIDEYNYGGEALHGVKGPGKFTVFPMSIALGATWDRDLIHEVTTAISDEARARAVNPEEGEPLYPGVRFLTFWSPTINMARDPRWGRTAETYGEDPYLTGEIGLAFVAGLQGDDPRYIKAVSSPKHFVANNEEHDRFRCNAEISQKDLHEYYFPAFKKAVTEGHAQSVMSAYNAVNGTPCSANSWLLNDVLRGEWGFDGYVVSDCDAVAHLIAEHRYVKTGKEAAAAGLNGGVDLECGGGRLYPTEAINAIKDGLLTEATVDRAVERLLQVRMRLGMFDPPEMVPYSKIPVSVVGSKEHQALALRAAQESMVLLKNAKADGSPMLPLDANAVKSIAVVGPIAETTYFGDYSGEPVNDPVSTLDGIKNKVGKSADIRRIEWLEAAEARDFDPIPPENFKISSDGAAGVQAEYFANLKLEGAPAVSRVEAQVDLNRDNAPTAPPVIEGPYSARWTGTIVSSLTGAHGLTVSSSGDAKVWLNGELVFQTIDKQKKKSPKAGQLMSRFEFNQYSEEVSDTVVFLEVGRSYEIKVEYVASKNGCLARLKWAPPKGDEIEIRKREYEAIRDSDVVVATMGIWRVHEHESVDRLTLDIPRDQREYIKQVVRLNPNTVVVLSSGSPLSVNWIAENAPAILENWYSGEQGGNAVADILFGDYNPSGRLPVTFYKSLKDLPPFNDYAIAGKRTYMHFKGKPLYPFGYGLSYTSFEYGDLTVDKAETGPDGIVTASFTLKNAGGREGDEVAQLYVRDLKEGELKPIKRLKGFERVSLAAGESKTVSIPLKIKDLAYWSDEAAQLEVEPGEYEIQVGASSADIRLKTTIKVVK